LTASGRLSYGDRALRLLFTCLPGFGHFLPMVPLARASAAAGHDVCFATAAAFCPQVEKAGFEAFAAGLSLPEQMQQAARRYPEQHAMAPGKERFEAFVPRMLAGVAGPARAADLAPIVERLEPDLLVHDETDFGGPLAAAAAGIPYADHSVGFLRPLDMARLAGATLAPLADQWGVDVGEFGGMFRYLYLDVCPPSLQSPEIDEIDVAHQMQNAHIDAGDEQLPDWIGELAPVPTVYVSLGTIFNQKQEVFAAILEALRDENLNVIVTIGGGNDPAALGPQPDNVHVEQFIPQGALLPYCDLAINQGGTAILPLLAAGLPLLVMPQSANQFHNAEACVAAGVGRAILQADVGVASVRREMRALREDPRFRERAEEIARETELMPPPEHGVELLERLARERSRVLRPRVAP